MYGTKVTTDDLLKPRRIRQIVKPFDNSPPNIGHSKPESLTQKSFLGAKLGVERTSCHATRLHYGVHSHGSETTLPEKARSGLNYTLMAMQFLVARISHTRIILRS